MQTHLCSPHAAKHQAMPTELDVRARQKELNANNRHLIRYTAHPQRPDAHDKVQGVVEETMELQEAPLVIHLCIRRRRLCTLASALGKADFAKRE
jgi:hypothetical protein